MNGIEGRPHQVPDDGAASLRPLCSSVWVKMGSSGPSRRNRMKGVVDEAGPEQARHDDFAQKSRDAGHRRTRDHPSRPDYALGRRRIVDLGRQIKPTPSRSRLGSSRLAHSQLFEKVRSDVPIIAEAILLVGRVHHAWGGAKTHKNGWYAQMRGEIADERNGPAIARQHGGLTEHLTERLGRDTKGGMFGLTITAGAALKTRSSMRMPGGAFELQKAAKQLEDFIGILIRHETKADLGGNRLLMG